MQARCLYFIWWRYGSLEDGLATQLNGGAVQVGVGTGTSSSWDLRLMGCGHGGIWALMEALAMSGMVFVAFHNRNGYVD